MKKKLQKISPTEYEAKDGTRLVFVQEGGWMLFDRHMGCIDHDQFRHDVAQRNNLELIE